MRTRNSNYEAVSCVYRNCWTQSNTTEADIRKSVSRHGKLHKDITQLRTRGFDIGVPLKNTHHDNTVAVSIHARYGSSHSLEDDKTGRDRQFALANNLPTGSFFTSAIIASAIIDNFLSSHGAQTSTRQIRRLTPPTCYVPETAHLFGSSGLFHTVHGFQREEDL